jgi:hypothetical protein
MEPTDDAVRSNSLSQDDNSANAPDDAKHGNTATVVNDQTAQVILETDSVVGLKDEKTEDIDDSNQDLVTESNEADQEDAGNESKFVASFEEEQEVVEQHIDSDVAVAEEGVGVSISDDDRVDTTDRQMEEAQDADEVSVVDESKGEKEVEIEHEAEKELTGESSKAGNLSEVVVDLQRDEQVEDETAETTMTNNSDEPQVENETAAGDLNDDEDEQGQIVNAATGTAASETGAATIEAAALEATARKDEQEATDAAIAVAEQQAEEEEAAHRERQEADDAKAAATAAEIERAVVEEAASIERAANVRASEERTDTAPWASGASSPGLRRAESHGEDELSMIRALVSAEENRDADKLSETYSRMLGKDSARDNGSVNDSGSDNAARQKLDVDTLDGTSQQEPNRRGGSFSGGGASNGVGSSSPTRTVAAVGSAVVANILATLRDTRLDSEGGIDQRPPGMPESLAEEGSVDLAMIGSTFERYLLEELLKQVSEMRVYTNFRVSTLFVVNSMCAVFSVVPITNKF